MCYTEPQQGNAAHADPCLTDVPRKKTISGVQKSLNSSASSDLPKFKRPPVLETVLGVQFDPLAKLSNAHLGVFWEELGQGWPNVNDAQRLDRQFETFGKGRPWAGSRLQLDLRQPPSSRVQIRNSEEDRMIQVQNDGFHYNWLGHEGKEYPHYHVVRLEFDHEFKRFLGFLEKHSIEEPKTNQWEVTYVNHMPKGTVWNVPGDWPELFPPLVSLSHEPSSLMLETFRGDWKFEITQQLGRLHVQIMHGLKNGMNTELLVMKLTARGPIDKSEGKGLSLDDGLNLGRRTIVTAFKELTSEKAHDYWGLIHDHNAVRRA